MYLLFSVLKYKKIKTIIILMPKKIKSKFNSKIRNWLKLIKKGKHIYKTVHIAKTIKVDIFIFKKNYQFDFTYQHT